MPPSAYLIPDTPLLRYFRAKPYLGREGSSWGDDRVAETERLLLDPHQLATLFDLSVKKVESEYRNYQPFYPTRHVFGLNARTGLPHGQHLGATVDVAARLAKRDEWMVPDWPELSFRYIDREIEIARSKPGDPDAKEKASKLKIDLLLANSHDRDRTPILCELKLRGDECALYALVQLLTQAAYATTQSQRERLVLFGSRPEFVLREALPGQTPTLDLYVLLVEPPSGKPHAAIRPLATELSHKLIADPLIGERIGCIAWIEAKDDRHRGLKLISSEVARSKFRRPGLPSQTRPEVGIKERAGNAPE